MKRIENNLKNQMKASNDMSYPDFDRMWESIQQDELKVASEEPVALRSPKRKRFAIVAGLSLALIGTQVYAALTYDWSNLLSNRAGIQSALEQGLGQTIGQSITKDGVTLTVHTAFIDDNRTFLLYSLKPDSSWAGKQVSFDLIGLKDHKGNFIEGNYVHQWNEELGEFQGFFETDWVAEGQTADVELTMENIRFASDGKQSINYDPHDLNAQVFQIQKDGIGSLTLQLFEQSGDHVLLQSSIIFTDPEMKSGSFAHIQAINDRNEPIKEVETPLLGTPGASGEYLGQQIFKSDSIRAEGTQFQLTYQGISGTVEGVWSLNMALSKKQMENGSFKEALNIPLEQVPGGTKINEMTITPTQVRLLLTHEQELTRVPYLDYQLDVGGTLLNGSIRHVPDQFEQSELSFEMPGLDSASIANQPVTLIAKHRVDEFSGDDNPIHLTDISAEPQSLTTHIAGYPITWTYYMKDNNLYVESLSSDPAFGGVNQTYYLEGKDRSYGKPVMVGLVGDENNKHIDVYENFDRTELDIYIWKYTTHKRNEELRVPLKPGK